MEERFERTKLLVGNDNVEKLSHTHIAVFGVGGVGGYVVEALTRAGVGEMTIVDKDDVSISNINRQIIALESTIGKSKVEVFKERMLDINPEIKIHDMQIFYLPDTAEQFDFSKYDYVVDAVDNVTAKLTIIEEAKKANVPVISAMGAGNKLDPTAFKVSDISKSSVCPLAKVMRRELKKRGIRDVKCVYSTEEARQNDAGVIGSIAFVPSVAGLIIASEVVKDITGYGRDN